MEKNFYRTILPGVFTYSIQKSELTISKFFEILKTFCGKESERRQTETFLLEMENQSIFGYSIKIHNFQVYDKDNLLALKAPAKFFFSLNFVLFLSLDAMNI